MRDDVVELVWRGIREANPWWVTGSVPPERARPFRRHAFAGVYRAVRGAERGRGVVVLGPRRVGKTVLLHQVVEELLASGVAPACVVMLSLDDVALRGADLGELLELVERRAPPAASARFLLLDEVQHAPEWAGWLKRIADRRDPWVFLATGSSATALRRGGQDAGLGRWQELVLFPWSFREHVAFRELDTWTLRFWDQTHGALDAGAEAADALTQAGRECGARPPGEDGLLENALVDYLVRGGFPEVAAKEELREAQRHLRQDILDRALGRDLLDVTGADSRTLERMFLRICQNPGGLWSTSEVANELQLARQTVSRYLSLLEQAFLVLSLPNLASPVKGQPKVYLVAPALRAALYGFDADAVRAPEEWGRLVENLVISTMIGARPDARQIGFWRRGDDEVDAVAIGPTEAEYVEVKRSQRPDRAVRAIERAAASLGQPGRAWVLQRLSAGRLFDIESLRVDAPLRTASRVAAVEWLYVQRGGHGGTLRMTPG